MTQITRHSTVPSRVRRAGLTLLLAAAGAAGLSACAPLVVGGAMVGGVLVATDRRTSGAQLEDQAIELKAMNRIREAVGDRAHVNATSYNRMVLLTGEAPTEQDRQTIEQTVSRIENVRSIVNEIAIMGNTSLTARSNDVILASKVKATFIDARDVQSNTVKVVTERGIVYLLGIVTEREGNRVAELARSISGVQKVVKVFETITEDELKRLQPQQPPKQPPQAS
jgi:osmotically-inducible protein OsmY